MTGREAFRAARDLLIAHREDYAVARRDFRWPPTANVTFNWALDHFDALGREQPGDAALIVRKDDGSRQVRSFSELSQRSNQVANLLRSAGVRRGDRVLLMLPNVVALWEAMLGCMKLGAVVVPATTQLTPSDIEDRVARGHVRHVVTDTTGQPKIDAVSGFATKLLCGGSAPGWRPFTDVDGESTAFEPDAPTRADDPMLLYFTSGTTAKPKLVMHTHASYPVGHLSTMYWIGLRAGDVHWNISSPGWAKHAWSNVFAPWNAGATVLVLDHARFMPKAALSILKDENVTTLCAPPTVWRMLILEDLAAFPHTLREAVAAGEPLNPEIISRVESAWGITVRDGYGQTETTALVGNSPGQAVKPGSMGRPLPGYDIVLAGAESGGDGEIAIITSPRPTGLMIGYEDDPEQTAHVMRDDRYHTGDVARADEDGYITYVGRADDVFKASDYRISPFELESVLLEHPAVAEAAVVPSPDPLRLAVPKAFLVLAPGHAPSHELGREIMAFVRARVAPYKRIKRLEFRELPKTISGKIRRVELRQLEASRRASGASVDGEIEAGE
ncbi:MAG: AMP-binding protein [Polyangiaceae bacterium]|nr:AMP-binding protein [Polyangiaceae bacterium]